ncbi:large conductance mechanosensitive channel protein MscL [Acidisoma cladoniae]|jgi:large conductance mechanosensitive channel|uniref:large conductance mechanosensitive channel protein MscL n=1 Tax=Acidisoma cladoniae TaxID=3040935 RepID=UPI0025517131|nr:large conductance mechanosensitive channel protein MscL [Acidisoma sp. PAMC 29798]
MAQFDFKTLPRRPAWLEEFQSFIMRGNVIDLAVGIIIGAAFTTIVGSLVKDILTPILGLIIGGIDFTNIFFTLKGPHLATLADAQKAGAVTLNVGVFINAVINFAIISFAIFWLVKLVSKLYRRPDAEPAPPPASEILLTEIRDLLKLQTVARPASPTQLGPR